MRLSNQRHSKKSIRGQQRTLFIQRTTSKIEQQKNSTAGGGGGGGGGVAVWANVDSIEYKQADNLKSLTYTIILVITLKI